MTNRGRHKQKKSSVSRIAQQLFTDLQEFQACDYDEIFVKLRFEDNSSMVTTVNTSNSLAQTADLLNFWQYRNVTHIRIQSSHHFKTLTAII